MFFFWHCGIQVRVGDSGVQGVGFRIQGLGCKVEGAGRSAKLDVALQAVPGKAFYRGSAIWGSGTCVS